MGTVFSFIVSGFLCNSDFLGGWPSVFIVFGASGVLWFLLWTILVTSSPGHHPWISDEEKAFIAREIAKNEHVQVCRPLVTRASKAMVGTFERGNPPWAHILRSMPFWAIVVSHTSHNWGFYTLLTELPTYISDILGFDIKNVQPYCRVEYILMGYLRFPEWPGLWTAVHCAVLRADHCGLLCRLPSQAPERDGYLYAS